MARGEQRPVLDLPDAKTAEEWRGVLAGLARDEAEMDARLEAVRAERKGIALAIARGEPAAVKRNEALNAEQLDLLNKLDLLLMVRGAAQEQLAALEVAEAAVAAEMRRTEGAALARELLAVSGRADAAMREAASALAERAVLARRLGSYGANLNALTNRLRLAAAAGHAGVGDQLPLRNSPRPLHAPLPEMDRKILAGVLGERAPDEPPVGNGIPGQLGNFVIGRPAAPAVPAVPAAERDPDVRW